MALGFPGHMAAGLASSPLRMMGGQGAPSAEGSNFFARSGLGNNFADFAQGLRGVTSNFAAGFGKDPYVRAQAAQTAQGIEAQQADTRRQILEMTFGNLDKMIEGLKGAGTLPPATQAMLDKSFAHLEQIGVPAEIIDETRNYAQVMITTPQAAGEPNFQSLADGSGQTRMVDMNNPAEVQAAAAEGFTQEAGSWTSDVLSPEALAQKERLAAAGRSSTTVNIDNKPISEGQAQSLGFADRANASERIIQEVTNSGYRPSKVEETLGGIPVIGNALISDERRRYESAKLDFISAVLRKESGAVINYEPGGEYDKEDKKYFPQPGDDDQTIADKAARRAQAIANLHREGRPVSGEEARETAGASESEPMAVGDGSQQSPVVVSSPEEAAELKSGTWFKTPDGRVLQRQ